MRPVEAFWRGSATATSVPRWVLTVATLPGGSGPTGVESAAATPHSASAATTAAISFAGRCIRLSPFVRVGTATAGRPDTGGSGEQREAAVDDQGMPPHHLCVGGAEEGDRRSDVVGLHDPACRGSRQPVGEHLLAVREVVDRARL